MRNVQITFMEVPYAENLAAVVRYTMYDADDRALVVRQVEYRDDPEGVQELDEAVERAIENDIDVTVLSCYSPDYFPTIHQYVDTKA